MIEWIIVISFILSEIIGLLILSGEFYENEKQKIQELKKPDTMRRGYQERWKELIKK
jgi:hypothetical protein